MSDDDDAPAGPTPIVFRDLTPKHEGELRKLNAVIFPIRYSDKFYVECAAASSATQLAFCDGVLAGAIACRLELLPDRSGAKLYVMTVGVLAPYRDLQIGTRLLQHSLNFGSSDPFITEAYLHVQTNNHSAIDFYKSKFGFVERGVAYNYYKRLEPPDAAVLSIDLTSYATKEVPLVTYAE